MLSQSVGMVMASVRGAQRAVHSEEEHGGYDLGEAVMGGLDAGSPCGCPAGSRELLFPAS